jgi:hypothetical protein
MLPVDAVDRRWIETPSMCSAAIFGPNLSSLAVKADVDRRDRRNDQSQLSANQPMAKSRPLPDAGHRQVLGIAVGLPRGGGNRKVVIKR